MTVHRRFPVSPGWKILLADQGLDVYAVLRRAELPGDLFARAGFCLTTEEYFRLWTAMEEETGDSLLGLRVGENFPVEAFDPPLFAALCSPNLETALTRLARYKILMGAVLLHVDSDDERTAVTLQWMEKDLSAPAGLNHLELVFLVQMARTATRSVVTPLSVGAPVLPLQRPPYEQFFGVAMTESADPTVTFSATDVRKPFLTANDAMWRHFEGDLSRRLADLTAKATTHERVRATLLECLPSGESSIGEVAKRLGVSSRTLQRRLAAENRTFQSILDETRESLARHYLRNTSMSSAEISFLLGYEDPSSFSRAFSAWTGTSPERARASMMT